MDDVEIRIKSEASEAASAIDRLIDSLRSLKKNTTSARMTAKSMADGLKAMGTTAEGASKALKGVGKDATSTAKKMGEMSESVDKATKQHNSLLASIGKVAKYRLLRSIISGTTKALKEGITNLYMWSKAAGGDFAKSMDEAASSATWMKNSLATVLAPALMSLIPILSTVASAVNTVSNALSALFAFFGGKSTYTVATKSSEEFAKATKKVGGAAKSADDEIKELLADFDELNIIQQENAKSSGGGGSGAAAVDYSGMFEERELPEWALALQEKLEPFLSWANEHFGALLTTALAIGAAIKAWKIAQSLIDGISELIKKFTKLGDSSKEVGDKLGKIDVPDTSKLDELINKLNKIDLSKLTGPLNTLKNLDLSNLVSNLNQISELADKLMGLTRGLDILNQLLPLLAGLLLSMALKGLSKLDFSSSIKGAKELKDKLDEIKTALQEIQKELDNTSTKWVEVKDAIQDKLTELVTFVKESTSSMLEYFEQLFAKIKEQFNSFGIFARTSVKLLVTDLKDSWVDYPTWFNDNVKDPLIDVVRKMVDAINAELSRIERNITVTVRINQMRYTTTVNTPDTGGNNDVTEPDNSIRPEDMPVYRVDYDDNGTNLVNNFLHGSPLAEFLKEQEHEGSRGGGARRHIYAEGGFPNVGEVYLAREAGNELLGRIGSRNAVANNDQIVEGIASGVAQANSSMEERLARIESIISTIASKDFKATFEPTAKAGRGIHEALNAYARVTG